MYSSTYLNWFRRLLILGAVAAGLTATAAGAGIDSRPPDVSDVASGLFATQATIVSRPPDVQDAAASVSAATPDVFERYATEHPYGFDLTSSELVSSPPDVQDAAAALHTMPAQSTLVSRPPDVSDAAQVTASVSTTRGNGFDWNDWAIGIGTGLGLALLLGVGFMVGRQQRHRVQPA
jgi:hypothetical protein